MFDLDSQYIVYMIADFSAFVINSLNHEIRRRRAEHSRTLLNQYAVKIFSQNSLSDLNKVCCEAIRKMLQTERVKFCFISESLVDVDEYEIIAFKQIKEYPELDEDNEDYESKKDYTYEKFKTK